MTDQSDDSKKQDRKSFFAALKRALILTFVLFVVATVAVEYIKGSFAKHPVFKPLFYVACAVGVVFFVWYFCGKLKYWRQLPLSALCGTFGIESAMFFGVFLALRYLEPGNVFSFSELTVPDKCALGIVIVSAFVAALATLALFVKKIVPRSSQTTATAASKPEPSEATSDSPRAPKRKLADLTGAEIIEWAKREAPLENDENDFFQFGILSNRIAERIEKRANEKKCDSIGLCGGFGAGKSSVVNMARRRLERDSRFVCCRLSFWGYESPTAAATALLNEIVERLEASGVWVDEIRDVGKRYAQIVKDVASTTALGGACKSLIDAFVQPEGSETSRKRLFRKIGDALKRCGKYLVLVLEDVDRNVGANGNNRFTISDFMAIAQMFKDNTKNTTLIITGDVVDSTQNKEGVDFQKLCDRIEYIPRMKIENVQTLFVRLKRDETENDCEILYMKDFGGNDDPNLLFLYDPVDDIEAALYKMVKTDCKDFRENTLFSLPSTPRVLKQIVVELKTLWEKLRGECNYEQLALLCILKICEPEAFAFIFNNIKRFQTLYPKIRKSDSSKDKETLSNVSNDDAESFRLKCYALKSRNGLSLLGALDALFQESNSSLLQNMRSNNPDYFNRISYGALGSEELRDQQIFRSIKEFNSGNLDSFVELLIQCPNEQFQRIDRCSTLLNMNFLQNLTKQVFMREFQISAQFMGGELGKFIWNLWEDKNTILFKDLSRWFNEIYSEILPQNLLFVSDIHYFFAARYFLVPDPSNLIARYLGFPTGIKGSVRDEGKSFYFMTNDILLDVAKKTFRKKTIQTLINSLYVTGANFKNGNKNIFNSLYSLLRAFYSVSQQKVYQKSTESEIRFCISDWSDSQRFGVGSLPDGVDNETLKQWNWLFRECGNFICDEKGDSNERIKVSLLIEPFILNRCNMTEIHILWSSMFDNRSLETAKTFLELMPKIKAFRELGFDGFSEQEITVIEERLNKIISKLK